MLENAFQKAGLEIVFEKDMLAVQWAKLLLNLNNSINALSKKPLKEQLSIRKYRQCVAMAQQEALVLLDYAQIKPAKLTAVPTHLIPNLLSLPNPLFKLLSRKMLAIDPLAWLSMQDDLIAGRPTEVDWINGEVLKLAEQSGRQAPINARLIALIKQSREIITIIFNERRCFKRSVEIFSETVACGDIESFVRKSLDYRHKSKNVQFI